MTREGQMYDAELVDDLTVAVDVPEEKLPLRGRCFVAEDGAPTRVYEIVDVAASRRSGALVRLGLVR